MAYGYIDFGTGSAGGLTGSQSGSGGTFPNLTLDYINTSDIYVVRTTSAGVQTTLTSSQFTVTTSPSLTVTIASSVTIATSDLIRIGRVTSIAALTRTFTDGSVLKASDINFQNKQLLFATQENVDGGVGSLPIDTDGKYDADGKIIKNLGSGNDSNDAVSRGYVDGLTLYGTGTTTPQSWTHTTASGDVDGNHRAFTLTSPTPNSTSDEMYLVEVGGVLQTPADYNITESGGTYTITLLEASDAGSASVANGVAVIVRNFGVSRHVFKQPLKPDSASDVAFTVQRLTSSSSHAKLQEWVDEASTPNVLASVDREGNAAFKALSLTAGAAITGNSTITGDLTVSGDLSLTGADTATVRQIIKGVTGATFDGGSSSNFYDSTTDATHFRCGYYISITPKSASSKLLFYGNVDTYILTSTTVASVLSLTYGMYKNATNPGTTGSEAAGGSIVPEISSSIHKYSWGDAPSSTGIAHRSDGLSILGIMDSPGAGTPVTFDLVGSSEIKGQGSWKVLTTSSAPGFSGVGGTNIWCIEIG